uniref:pectinesterase n=2 Tax=Davidia involucrata TaxID=16924 RepID=A0A5B7AJS4_DAVIN
MGSEDGRRRSSSRRATVLGVSSILLVAMVVAVTVGIERLNESGKNLNPQDISASRKAIETICQPTNYKEVCVNSLSSSAGNTTDPRELIRVGFELAKNQINEAAKNSTVLQELQKDPRTKQALSDCQELAEMAVSDLERSFEQLGNLDLSKFDDSLANLKTWLSGAITHQETCLDGFESTTGDAGEKMREYLQTAMQLTSNALTMVTEISSMDVLTRSSRRLLSDEALHVFGHGHGQELLPFWLNAGTRRLLDAQPQEIKPDLIIAKDGSGKYRTINEALEDIPKKKDKTFVIYIKEGVYEEKVQFNRSMTHLMIIGDGPTKTRITGGANFIDGTTTFHTATVVALGEYFIARDIGFENSAGPEKHQAVALRVGADMSIFYNCDMDGYQDTLYAHTYRQFYRDCRITGTIDFLFGDSAALFQNCTMLVRKPLPNQQCIVTAQGRKEKNQTTGIVLQNCTITADPSYRPVQTTFKSYLGRPWKEFSRTIIMESYIDDLIMPEGWLPWNGNFALDTCHYAEFNNRGPASSKLNRVRWRGVKNVSTTSIQRYTASVFIAGDSWIPLTGVPYAPGLIYDPPPNDGNDYDDEDEDDHAPVPALSPESLLAAPSPIFPPQLHIAPQPTSSNLPSKPTFINNFKMFFRGL